MLELAVVSGPRPGPKDFLSASNDAPKPPHSRPLYLRLRQTSLGTKFGRAPWNNTRFSDKMVTTARALYIIDLQLPQHQRSQAVVEGAPARRLYWGRLCYEALDADRIPTKIRLAPGKGKAWET